MPPAPELLRGTQGFHLLLAAPEACTVWSWDGATLSHSSVDEGDHVLVYHGLDAEVNPRATHARSLLRELPDVDPRHGPPTAAAWGPWADLLAAGGVGDDDPRTILQRRILSGRPYGSTSASLVALRPGSCRHDFAKLASETPDNVAKLASETPDNVAKLASETSGNVTDAPQDPSRWWQVVPSTEEGATHAA
jgi:hypothetical protein